MKTFNLQDVLKFHASQVPSFFVSICHYICMLCFDSYTFVILGSSTLPRTQQKSMENGNGDLSGSNTLPNRDKVTTGTSSTSLYDTVGTDKLTKQPSIKLMKDRETATPGGKISSHIGINAQTPHAATTSTSTSTISGIASQTEDVSY